MHYQVIILGAGPGGLQMGYFLKKLGINYVILEKSRHAGSFFRRMPIHRKLISINKIHTGHDEYERNLRWDWNSLLSDERKPLFSSFDDDYYPNADNLVDYLNQFAQTHELNIFFNHEVNTIDKDGDLFSLKIANESEFRSELLVNSAGLSKSFIPDIEGIENAIDYADFDCNFEAYKNKQILILGKGNSAFETANSLLHVAANIHLISPSGFKTAAMTHHPGHVRSVNYEFIDTFFLKQQNAMLNGNVLKIENIDGKYKVHIRYMEDKEVDVHTYDYLINCTGFTIDTSFFSSNCMPKLVHADRLPLLNPYWESENVSGLFFAGTLMQSNDYKRSSSPLIHGIRHNVKSLAEIIRSRLSQTELSFEAVDSKADIFKIIASRIKSSSSLWFLYSTLLDVFSFDEANAQWKYYNDLPHRVFKESELFRDFNGYVFSFGYENPKNEVENKKFSAHGFLHPILKYYRAGALAGEAHIQEDIYGEWSDIDRWGKPFLKLLC